MSINKHIVSKNYQITKLPKIFLLYVYITSDSVACQNRNAEIVNKYYFNSLNNTGISVYKNSVSAYRNLKVTSAEMTSSVERVLFI